MHDFVNAPRRHISLFGQPILRDPKRFHEFFQQDFAIGSPVYLELVN